MVISVVFQTTIWTKVLTAFEVSGPSLYFVSTVFAYFRLIGIGNVSDVFVSIWLKFKLPFIPLPLENLNTVRRCSSLLD